MRSRLETLRWLYGEAEEALSESTPDRKSALIGQLRGIAAEIEQIEGVQPEQSISGGGGLIDFQKALAERESKPGRSRRSRMG